MTARRRARGPDGAVCRSIAERRARDARFIFASRLDKDNGSDRPQQTVAPSIDKLGKAVRVNFELGIGQESELAARAMACDGPVPLEGAGKQPGAAEVDRSILSRLLGCSSQMKMSGLCQVEMSGSGGWKRHGGLTNGNRAGQHEPQGDRPT